MPQLESEMYEKVRRFIIDQWEASASLTGKDSGEGEGLSLDFAGIKVEPDVFGTVSAGGVDIPIMGEGKLRMGGHDGTTAFGQALAYRNLGMLAFLLSGQRIQH